MHVFVLYTGQLEEFIQWKRWKAAIIYAQWRI